MQQHRSRMLRETDDQAGDRQTASLGAVAITLLLLVISLFLVREMQTEPVIENGTTAAIVNQVCRPGDLNEAERVLLTPHQNTQAIQWSPHHAKNSAGVFAL
jgi:hypothetical protein